MTKKTHWFQCMLYYLPQKCCKNLYFILKTCAFETSNVAKKPYETLRVDVKRFLLQTIEYLSSQVN